jgi:hypothetical protein
MMLVKASVESMTNNGTSGKSAIMAFKEVELKFYSIILVMMIFVIPMSGTHDTTYSTYQCAAGHRYSMVTADMELPDSVESSISSESKLPIGWALMNNVMSGVSGALTGKMSCSDYVAYDVSELAKSMQTFDDKNLISSVKAFDKQCYSSAGKRLAESIYDGTTTLSEPYSEIANYFFGTNYLAAYSGTHVSPNLGSLTFVIDEDEWVGSGISLDSSASMDEETMTCSAAALELYTAIEENIDDEMLTLITNTDSMFKDDDGSYATKTTTTQKLVNYGFGDIRVNKEAAVSPDSNRSLVEMASYAAELAKNSATAIANTASEIASYWKDNDAPEMFGDVAMGVMHYGSSVSERFTKNLETVSMHAYLPVLLMLVCSMLYAGIPVLLLIGGYSWNVVWSIILVLGYLSISFYILELSYVFENVIVLAGQSEFGTLKKAGSNYEVLKMVSNSLAIIALAVWTMVCSLLGLNIIGALGMVFGGAAVKAGQNAAAVGKQIGQLAAKALAA